MISSRCSDRFPHDKGEPLSEVRRMLKDRLMAAGLFGQRVFDVWINEEWQGGRRSASRSSMASCARWSSVRRSRA
jgi:hypothetical protein